MYTNISNLIISCKINSYYKLQSLFSFQERGDNFSFQQSVHDTKVQREGALLPSYYWYLKKIVYNYDNSIHKNCPFY